MGFRALVFVLLCSLMLQSVAGLELEVKSRELGLADVPPCGVSSHGAKRVS